MLKRKVLSLFVALAVAATMSLVGVTPAAAAATVATDKADYAPEETVVITGSSFSPGASVLVTVTRPDASIVHWDPVTRTFVPGGETVTADSAGRFIYNYQLDGVIGTYTVNASDGISSATCTFLDTPVPYLHPLPEFTPGTSNTIVWDMVSNATEYEAQASTDSTFTTVNFDRRPIYPSGTATESYTFTGLSAGVKYYYRVRAFNPGAWPTPSKWSDERYVVFSTQEAAPPVDNPPTVAIGNPADSSTVSGTVSVTATATDDVGVARVEFYIDNVLKATSTVAPYACSWDTTLETNASHAVKAVAYDTIGQTATDVHNVTVNNVAPDTQPPVINGTTRSGTGPGNPLTVVTHATDNVAVAAVKVHYLSSTYLEKVITMTLVSGTAQDGNYQATIPGADVVSDLEYYISAVDSSGNASTSGFFTVPSITSLSPSSGPVGTSVTISGSNFGATQGSSTVTFNGVAATVGSWSGTSIIAVAPSGTTTGPVVVTVGGQASNGVAFTVTLPPAPTVSLVSPSYGPTAGGNAVTVTGTNFVSGATLTLGGGSATAVTVVNSTTITATSGAHSAGLVDVVVTNPDSQSGTLVSGYTYTDMVRVEETAISYGHPTNSTAWGYYTPSSGGPSNGTQSYTKYSGAWAEYTFNGTGIDWLIAKQENYAIAALYIDGVFQQDVDLYSPTRINQVAVFSKRDLPSGSHTIRIVHSGTKNPASFDWYIGVDAFDVVASGGGLTRIQEQSFVLTGTWGSFQNSTTSGGTQNWTKTAGSSASYTFTGTGVDWVVATKNNYGIANVYIDGVLQQSVDLYRSGTTYQDVAYSKRGLAAGTHTIKIECTGTKNAASYDYYIGIDALNIWQ